MGDALAQALAPDTASLARHQPVLDGVRCVAIVGVVWHHSLPRAVEGWLGRGHMGVPLFFALSGFLITLRLLAERRDTGDIALGRFWLRRGLRILPLYYVVLIGFVLALAAREPTAATRHFFSSLPFYASYTSNWFIDFNVAHPVSFAFAWSLATEEQFYLWWPPLLRRAEQFGRFAAPLALVCLVGLDQLMESGVLSAWLTPGSSPARIATSLSSAMLLGACCAWFLVHPRVSPRLGALLGARPALAAATALTAGWVVAPFGPPLLVDALLAGVVGAAALNRGRGLLGRALALRPVLHIGRVSYGIYLFHVPLLAMLWRSCPWLVERPLPSFVLTLALAAAVASVSHRYLEAPLLALKERLRPVPRLAGPARLEVPAGARGAWAREL
jgi:peptidoglycan/LPS O-acetylase OafA/YrhL